MKIPWHPVSSSNLRAVAFLDGIGYVEFHSGARWAYEMPRQLFDDMMAAKSLGTFYRRNVRSRCKVSWTGHRCSFSPCMEDATVSGIVSSTKFFLCDVHAKDCRYAGINFNPIVLREPGIMHLTNQT